MTPAALTDFLHSRIPLIAAMEARVIACDEGEVRIAAPLAPNRNHRGTAFGGSLSTLAIACGWSLLRVALAGAEVDAQVMIRNSDCRFLTPATRDFHAVTHLPEADWPQFLHTLARRPRARISLDTEVLVGEQPVLRHAGVFVAAREGGVDA